VFWDGILSHFIPINFQNLLKPAARRLPNQRDGDFPWQDSKNYSGTTKNSAGRMATGVLQNVSFFRHKTTKPIQQKIPSENKFRRGFTNNS